MLFLENFICFIPQYRSRVPIVYTMYNLEDIIKFIDTIEPQTLGMMQIKKFLTSIGAGTLRDDNGKYYNLDDMISLFSSEIAILNDRANITPQDNIAIAHMNKFLELLKRITPSRYYTTKNEILEDYDKLHKYIAESRKTSQNISQVIFKDLIVSVPQDGAGYYTKYIKYKKKYMQLFRNKVPSYRC